MSNLSVLDANVCHALAGAALGQSDEARHEAEAIYLRWKPRGWVKAEACALEWLRMRPLSARGLYAAAEIQREQLGIGGAAQEAGKFMRERLERNWFPGKRAE